MVDAISISVFSWKAFLTNTQTLAVMSSEANGDQQAALCTAVIVMGAATLEALLAEAAFLNNRPLYDDRAYRKAGVLQKYKLLTSFDPPEDLSLLWTDRLAISHAEPNNERARFVGERQNPEGAKKVVAIVERTSNEVWSGNIPHLYSI